MGRQPDGVMTTCLDYICHYDSPLGGITLAADGDALTGLWFDGQKHFGATLSSNPIEKQRPVFQETKRWLDIYFSGRDPAFTPPLHLRATPFRRAVWEILLTIPYGRTTTYGAIAARLAGLTGEPAEQPGQALGGDAKSAAIGAAVGGAVGHNAISLIIPCHRVIGADGALTGYAGGTERKLCLLRMESAPVSCSDPDYFAAPASSSR